jgi:hypothetical protein
MVQFLLRYGKTQRARSNAESEGAPRDETGFKSKTETTALLPVKKIRRAVDREANC